MAATVQRGTALKIGFGNNIYTGYVMQDFTKTPTGEQAVIKDENNATMTILVSDLGNQIDFTAIVLNTGSLTPPALGAAITVDTVNYRCISSNMKHTVGATVFTFSGIKEDSMSYTA
jgi:hypothetical protein